jgi:hypothetical protein
MRDNLVGEILAKFDRVEKDGALGNIKFSPSTKTLAFASSRPADIVRRTALARRLFSPRSSPAR